MSFLGDMFGGSRKSGRQSLDRLDREQKALQGGFQTRYDQAMRMMRGMGKQEAGDINQRYAALAGAKGQGLVGRGFAGLGGTAAASMGMGVERERSGALGRLFSGLAQQRVGAHERMSLGGLQSRQQMAQMRSSLEQQLRELEYAERQTNRKFAMQMGVGAAGAYTGGMKGIAALGQPGGMFGTSQV